MSRVCILRHAYYPADPRARKEAEALAACGHRVDVLCLRQEGQQRRERVNGVDVWRVPVRHLRRGKLRYVYEYVASFVCFGALVTWLHLRRRYDVVQANSMPDFLVFATVVPRLLGARVMLDLQECMPEIYMAKYRLRRDSGLVRLLVRMEQMGIAYADHVITCNEQMRQIFVSRGAPPDKISIVSNSADDQIFRPAASAPQEVGGAQDEFVLVSHGSIEARYGLDTAVRAMAVLREQLPGVRLDIYGDGESREELTALANSLQLDGTVNFKGRVPLEQLLQALREADAGLVTAGQTPELRWVHTFKMFEFIALGRPLVITRYEAVESYFDESCCMFFEPNDERDLARAVLELYNDPEKGCEMAENAGRVYETLKWEVEAPRYCRLVERVAERA